MLKESNKKEESQNGLISKIQKSKLYKTGIYAISSLLTALSLEIVSPSLEQIINNHSSSVYAAKNQEIWSSGNYIYVLGEGYYQASDKDSQEKANEIAKQRAIENGFERLGAIYSLETRLLTNEVIIRETGRIARSIWTEEMTDKFIVQYPSGANWDVLNDPKTYFRENYPNARVTLEIRISENDYRSFLEGYKLQRQQITQFESRLDSVYKTAQQDLRMLKLKHEILSMQDQVSGLLRTQAEIEENQQRVQELRGEIGNLQREIRQNYDFLSDMIKSSEEESINPQELSGYKRRLEELANDEMMASVNAQTTSGFAGKIAFVSNWGPTSCGLSAM